MSAFSMNTLPLLPDGVSPDAWVRDLLSAHDDLRDALPVVGTDLRPQSPEERAVLMELSRPLGALANSALILGDAKQYARAARLGLAGSIGSMRFEAVIFEGDTFKLAQRCETQFGAEVAFIFPALDADERTVDVVAWVPETGRVATLLGRIGTLGLSSLDASWHAPPLVHETVQSWLLADEEGLFVLAPKLAASELAGASILAADKEAGRRLRALLGPYIPAARRSPRIYVPRSREHRRV